MHGWHSPCRHVLDVIGMERQVVGNKKLRTEHTQTRVPSSHLFSVAILPHKFPPVHLGLLLFLCVSINLAFSLTCLHVTVMFVCVWGLKTWSKSCWGPEPGQGSQSHHLMIRLELLKRLGNGQSTNPCFRDEKLDPSPSIPQQQKSVNMCFSHAWGKLRGTLSHRNGYKCLLHWGLFLFIVISVREIPLQPGMAFLSVKFYPNSVTQT